MQDDYEILISRISMNLLKVCRDVIYDGDKDQTFRLLSFSLGYSCISTRRVSGSERG